VSKPMAIVLAGLVVVASGLNAAAESVRVAVPLRGSWSDSYTELGLQQGFFAQQGLDLKVSYVKDDAASEQALVSGEVDIAIASRFVGTLAAYAKGEPVRIISSQTTGAPDIFWFAKIAGPVASLEDLHGKAVGFSHPGSLSNFVLLTLLKEAGVNDAKLAPIGPAVVGVPEVLSTELDASWGTPPSAVKDLISGEIRIIARGDDSATVREETMRVNAVNANFLAAHRDAVLRFLQAYKTSLEWAYSGEPAIEAYAELRDQPLELVRYTVRQFGSQPAGQIDQIKGEDRALAEALAAKRIPHALSHEDVKGIYDLVLKQGS
jgi:NitT/TauT family transport system substrate-binding protein